MFHSHEATYPNFTYLPHQSNSTIPSLGAGPLFSQPLLHHTSIDPYALSSLYPSIHGGLGGQAPSYQDPNAVSQSWVVKSAGPVTYESILNEKLKALKLITQKEHLLGHNLLLKGDHPLIVMESQTWMLAVASSNEKALVSTSLSSLWSSNQPSVNDMATGIQQQTQAMQSLRCEVCNINCNSKDVFEKHISGKKHIRNVQIHSSGLVGQIGSVSHQGTLGSAGAASGQTLFAKRLKLVEGGAAADSVRVCTICNVVCNSQDVFEKHLTGKKHATQAGLRPRNVGVRPYSNGMWNKVPKKPKFVQSSWCEVCKINCTSSDVYTKHILGKKHLKNLEKLAEPKKDASSSASTAAQVATNPLIGPKEKLDAGNKGQSSASADADLDTKKQKIVEGGAAAGAVRACAVCNVVCNSEAVFNMHLTGHKHAAMVKKLDEPAAA